MGKDETRAALEGYFRAQAPRPKRRNKKPEVEETVKPCLAWLEGQGFSCHVVESKAVFSAARGRYLTGQAIAGMSDIVGCAPTGMAVFIEAKAHGRRSSLRPAQRAFLIDKIQHRAFAAVVDSARLLEETYRRWILLPPSLGVAFLLEQLPPIPRQRKTKAGDVELPF